MTTFWTGAAMAADYTHNRIRVFGEGMVSRHLPAQRKIVARREAYQCFNRAIVSAIRAQLDEEQTLGCLVDNDDDDWLMHGGGVECIHPEVYWRNLR
jgi:hypothetical protein